MQALLTALAVVWGAATGLLIPRAAHRLSVEPGERWRSACPEGRPLRGPFAGWLGPARCPGGEPATDAPPATDTPIAGPRCIRSHAFGPSTPVAMALTAAVCGALAAATGPRPELAAWLLGAPVALLLAHVDQAVRRLPDPLTWPLAGGTLLLLGLAALLPGGGGSWPTAVFGALALGAFYLLLVLINPRGLALGDAKLALTLGACLGWYGWTVLVGGAVTGLAFGALYGWTQVALRRTSRKGVAPLGPSLLAGALAWLLLGGLAT